MIENQGIAEFPCSDAKKPVVFFIQKVVELPPEITGIRMHCDQGIGQIELQDAIGAVQGAVEIGVDDKVVAAEIGGSAGAGFDKIPLLLGDQHVLFSLTERIPSFFKMSDDIAGIGDNLNRNVGQFFQDPFGERQCQALFINENFIRKISRLSHGISFSEAL